MKTRSQLYHTPSILMLLLSSVTVSLAQTAAVAPAQGPGVQSARDAREPQVLATCKHLAAPSTFKAPPGFKPPSGEAQEYSIGAIRGVIAAGTRWRTVWSVDDADGRVYVTEHGSQDGIDVFSNKGESLGVIPTPYPVISLAFGGPGKKTLYAVAETGKSPAQAAAILATPMIAGGYPARAK